MNVQIYLKKNKYNYIIVELSEKWKSYSYLPYISPTLSVRARWWVWKERGCFLVGFVKKIEYVCISFFYTLPLLHYRWILDGVLLNLLGVAFHDENMTLRSPLRTGKRKRCGMKKLFLVSRLDFFVVCVGRLWVGWYYRWDCYLFFKW